MINNILFLILSACVLPAISKTDSCEEVVKSYFSRNNLIILKCKGIQAFPEVSKTVTSFECIDCNIPILNDKTSIKNFKGNTFNLSNSYIQEIRPSAFTEVSLDIRHFDFKNNKISAIDPGLFSKFRKIYQINLSNNKISSLQPKTFLGIDLDILDLSQNSITSLDGAFNGLIIKNINLSSNAIAILPENVFCEGEQWKAYGYLDLSSNNIEIIRSKLFKCTEKTKCFTKLYLNQNSIKVIENGTFSQLNMLQLLSLHSNQITKLSKEIFQELNRLTTLELQNNKLSEIPEGIFNNLHQLRILDISQNSISKLKVNIFSGLTALTKLNISHNPLRVISNSLLLPLGKLNVLDISDVRIDELDISWLFQNILRLRNIVINDNFWTCNQVIQFYKVLNRKADGFSYPAHHYDVPNFHGIACSNEKLQYYDDLSFEEFLNVIADDKIIKDVLDTQSRDEEWDLEAANVINNISIINCLLIILTIIAIFAILMIIVQFITYILQRCNIVKSNSFSYLFR